MRQIFKPQLKLEPDSPIPLHHQISEGIMRELRQCQIPAGTVIASILTLATDLNLNRDTVRKAYTRLEEENVIRRSPGGRIMEVTADFVQRNAETQLFTIGIVLPTRMRDLLKFTNSTALEVVGGIMDEAAARSFSAMLVPLPDEASEVERLKLWLNGMLSKLNGLVYLGEDKNVSHQRAFEILLNQKGLPQVFISGHRFQEHLGIVEVDLKQAFRSEVDYLWKLGHRRLAVCGRRIPRREIFQLQTYDRIPELCAAVRERTTLPEEWIFESDLDFWNPRPWLQKILSVPKHPTALLCADDREAQNVVEVLHQLDWNVPHDIAVFGYGNTANYPGLGISTVGHPWFQTGCAAVEMIAESHRRTIPVNQLSKVLAAPLIIRGSTSSLRIK